VTRARRTKAGGAKKRPTRYAIGTTSAALATALRAHRHGEFESARRGYERAIADDPRALDAWMNLAAVNVVLGHARAASRAYDEAIDLAPDDARVNRDVGIGLVAIGAWQLARSRLERALALDPSLDGARLTLARLCLDAGDRVASLAFAHDAVTRAPGDASAHLELHRALFDDNDLGPAVSAARRASELDPHDAVARFFLAAALVWHGDSEEALAVTRAGTALTPGLVDALDFVRAHRTPTTRAFASKRDTLLHALSLAPARGSVLEFGVRHGVSTRLLADSVRDEIHAFDSFRGLPESWQSRAPGLFSTGGELPDLPRHVTLHVGWFDDTLPGFAAAHREPIRFVHIDSDLYSSAATVLSSLGPLLRPGAVIAFDEYLGNERWRDDEHRAFTEAVARFDWRYEFVSFSWITGQAVVRLTAPPG
jgi:Flp pilus assembly protein TadD/predicted O-methyltransferase YrrM